MLKIWCNKIHEISLLSKNNAFFSTCITKSVWLKMHKSCSRIYSSCFSVPSEKQSWKAYIYMLLLSVICMLHGIRRKYELGLNIRHKAIKIACYGFSTFYAFSCFMTKSICSFSASFRGRKITVLNIWVVLVVNIR